MRTRRLCLVVRAAQSLIEIVIGAAAVRIPPRSRCDDFAGGTARREGGGMITIPAGIRMLVATHQTGSGDDSLVALYASSSDTIRSQGRSASSIFHSKGRIA